MMLDVKIASATKDFLKYFPFGGFIGTIFLIEILLSVPSIFEKVNPYNVSFLFNYYADWLNKLDYFSEIMSVGHILYADYLVQFLLSGNILLLATIGPVVLVSIKTTKTSKFQVTFKQLARSYDSVLYIWSIKNFEIYWSNPTLLYRGG